MVIIISPVMTLLSVTQVYLSQMPDTAWRPTQEYWSHIIIITIAIIVIIVISWLSEPKTTFKHQTYGMCVGVGVKFPNTGALKPHHHWHCHNHHHHLTCNDFYVSDPSLLLKAKCVALEQTRTVLLLQHHHYYDDNNVTCNDLSLSHPSLFC